MHRILTDQLARRVNLPIHINRIVSLVPSHTELLFDLGLEDKISGVTKFCVNPPHIRKKAHIVGGTKDVRIEKIASLKPDVILANKEENTLEMVSSLEKIAPVWVTDVVSLADNNKMIADFGEIFRCLQKADAIIAQIQKGMQTLQAMRSESEPRKCLYLIWRNPYMAAGKSTFINTMIELSGFKNAVMESRYPEIRVEKFLEENHVDIVMLSSEPYPFSQKHIDELKVRFPKIKTMLVDGQVFSWHGSHVVKALDVFKRQ